MLRLLCICLLASIPATGWAQPERSRAQSIRVVVENDPARYSLLSADRAPRITVETPRVAALADVGGERPADRGAADDAAPAALRPHRHLTYAGLVAGLVLMLIVLLLSWNWALRRGIALRTRALVESDVLFRQLTEHVRDVFWVTTPPIDKLLYCSPAYESIWGRSLASLYANPRSFLEAIQPDRRDGAIAAIQKGHDEGFDIEYPIERPDGSVRWIRDRGFPIRDAAGNVYRTVGTCQDMTEHRASQARLRAAAHELEALSRRLVTLQESERKSLARELHDRVGQYLTALNINLTLLSAELSGHASEPLRARLADSEILIEATAAAVRNVVSELHPPMLEDHGLVPALEWYAAELSRRTGLSIVVGGTESADRPSAEVEIALFRIAQEALNNVVKHAGAKHVEILIERTHLMHVMTIDDDGVGMIRLGAEEARHAGLGLITMRERAAAVDGSFDVQALPSRGTRLTVRAPAQ